MKIEPDGLLLYSRLGYGWLMLQLRSVLKYRYDVRNVYVLTDSAEVKAKLARTAEIVEQRDGVVITAIEDAKDARDIEWLGYNELFLLDANQIAEHYLFATPLNVVSMPVLLSMAHYVDENCHPDRCTCNIKRDSVMRKVVQFSQTLNKEAKTNSKKMDAVKEAAARARANTTTRSKPPKLGKRLSSYKNAITAWIKAGRPERSDSEVDKLYETTCKGCPKRDQNSGTCTVCGCRVKGNEKGLASLLKLIHATALVNKIRMATEHCPLGKW